MADGLGSTFWLHFGCFLLLPGAWDLVFAALVASSRRLRGDPSFVMRALDTELRG